MTRCVEQKVSVADIGRELGARWRALSEDEKKLWKTRVDSINQDAKVGHVLESFDSQPAGELNFKVLSFFCCCFRRTTHRESRAARS